MAMNSKPSTPIIRKYHHLDTKYNYFSPTLENATKPLKYQYAESQFEYYPILSNSHVYTNYLTFHAINTDHKKKHYLIVKSGNIL